MSAADASSNILPSSFLRSKLQWLAWGLSLAVLVTAVVAWGQTWQWQLGALSIYQIFPIFGLVAFSTMWSQYIVAALGNLFRSNAPLKMYFKITGFVVLAAILLHPGLLVWQLWRDGFGLPPESFLQYYVAPSLRWVALIGSAALLIFLAYEFRYKFGSRPWWRYMEYLVDAAIIGVFYHGLRLGSQTYQGWFRDVWFFYGITLAAALIYKYTARYMP